MKTVKSTTVTQQSYGANESISEKPSQPIPNPRVILPKSDIQAIYDAAEATGNEHLKALITKGLATSFSIQQPIKPVTPPPPEPDQLLASKVEQLQKDVVQLATRVSQLRSNGPKQIRDHFSSGRAKCDDLYVSKTAQHQHGAGKKSALSVIPKPTKNAIKQLVVVSNAIKKTQKSVADTVRRVGNTSTVLQKLKDDAVTNNNDDHSQTIEADWTDTLNQSSRKRSRKNSSTNSTLNTSSPMPTHPPKQSDELEDPSVSPFVTPRSKNRKRTARYLGTVPPLRLDMPR